MKRMRRQKITRVHITYYLIVFILATIVLWPVYWIWAIPPFLPAILVVIFGPSYEEFIHIYNKFFKRDNTRKT